MAVSLETLGQADTCKDPWNQKSRNLGTTLGVRTRETCRSGLGGTRFSGCRFGIESPALHTCETKPDLLSTSLGRIATSRPQTPLVIRGSLRKPTLSSTAALNEVRCKSTTGFRWSASDQTFDRGLISAHREASGAWRGACQI